MEHVKNFSTANVIEFTQFLTTACAFSEKEAQERAVLAENIRVALYQGVVHFQFIKKNGELRDAYGTLNQELWHDKLGAPLPTNDNYKTKVGNIRFFDTEAAPEGWRQFTISRLIGIVED